MVGEPPEPQEVEPCVLYSDTKFATCNTCFSQTNFDGIDYPEGQDPDPNTPDFVIGGSGNICSSCSNCHKVDGPTEDLRDDSASSLNPKKWKRRD